MNIQSSTLHTASRRNQVSTLVATGLVIFSWFACYLWIMGMTEGWGAPWDIAPIRPPLGHWQRSINDFFESGVGMYLPVTHEKSLEGETYASVN